MSGRGRDGDALRAELAEVEARIAAHPLASRRIRAAHEVIDTSRSRDPAELDDELAAEQLPRVVELGRVQLAGTWSWWGLHRRKRQLQRRIERAGGR